MKHAKKMMLVPFVPNQTPTENKLDELNSQMNHILHGKVCQKADAKIKLYNQTLSKLIKQYDPSTLGLSPAVVELIKKLSQYLDNKAQQTSQLRSQSPEGSRSGSESTNLDEYIDDDLSYLFDSRLKVEDPTQKTLLQIEKSPNNLQIKPSKSDTALSSKDITKRLQPTQPPPQPLLKPPQPTKQEPVDFYDYEMAKGTAPAQSTRSKQQKATHPEGLESRINTRRTQPSTSNNAKRQSNQSGRGLWLRKCFF